MEPTTQAPITIVAVMTSPFLAYPPVSLTAEGQANDGTVDLRGGLGPGLLPNYPGALGSRPAAFLRVVA
ncbi:MAG TPA: hypothetical protein VMT20_07390 [Terriglobia bacterium]|nr:hypothetical protein [Terriglobia bacterium]